MRAMVLVPLLASACLRTTAHQCADDSECGAAGVCEPGGACSFPAADCDSGRRYGDDTGPLAGTCVDGVDVDAAVAADGGPDGPEPPTEWDYGDGHHGALTIGIDIARVNGYGSVRQPAAAGTRMLLVDLQDNATVGAWGARYAVGDRVLLWQTTGLPDATASGATQPATLSGDVGRWFVSRVTASNNSNVTLADPLPFAVTTDAQLVHVPELTTVTVGTGREIVPQAWNGDFGGIVAFYADNLRLEGGHIDATARGMRGGQADNNPRFDGCTELDARSVNGGGNRKGESLAPGRWGGAEDASGRGNLVHGGGGGDCHNSGGGGGALGGEGGRGGLDEMGRLVGGMGGVPLVFSPATYLAMGGGGGAGERNNSGAANGGAGGGVVFITARTITCTNGGSLDSDGGAGDSNSSDGGGGAGGAGLVWLRAETVIGCAVGANGGGGGNSNSPVHGSGGGGGGGRIWIFRDGGGAVVLSTGGGGAGNGGLNSATGGDDGSVCGNGTVEPGESCDDGNFSAGDPCTYCREPASN